MTKKLVIFLFVVLSSANIQAQLSELFVQKHKNSKGKSIFDQYGISLKYIDGVYVLLNSKNDSIIYQPKSKVFYEIFNRKYLLITEIDSVVIRKGLSTHPSLMPRYKVVIINLKNCADQLNYYVVNFNGKIVIENLNTIKPDINYYKLKVIDDKRRKVQIYNSVNSKLFDFDLNSL